MPSALTGFTVVDLTTTPAGALATMLLSDHGARVVRVVRSDDQVFRDGGFIIWDRGKHCVQLALDSDALLELVRSADVLVEDFAPSDAAQEGVQRLRECNPRLVSCSITAYGKRGPWKDEPPIDDLVLARMGVLASLPGFRPAPVHLVHPLPTVGAACLAALGVAAALYAREETGCGNEVETSLMAGVLMYHPKVHGERLDPYVFQTHPAGSAPFYSNYQCAEGNWIQLGCVHPGFVAQAAQVMGIRETLADPRFEDGRPQDPDVALELRAIVADVIRRKPYETWARELEDADVPYAPARWTEESLDDPQILHNAMLVELEDPVRGSVTQMGVALELSETPGKIQGPRLSPAPVAAREVSTGTTEATRLAGGHRELLSRHRRRAQSPPLADVRLLEITNLIAGPTAGRLLADLGADVIKIEPHAGDISRPLGRAYFYGVNFNKRSVCVDTRTPEGKEIVQRIAAKSDILLANLRPGATERMGITPELNPDLIEVHLTGYGWTGPYSKRPGIDPLASAYVGLLRAQGGRENPPVFPAELAPTDYTTGAMGALGAVLCLLTRRRQGIVQRAQSNLLNGAILLCSEWFSEYAGRRERPLADKDHLGLSPHHRLFEVADGWIYVAAHSSAELDGCLCRERTAAENLERLAKAGIPAGPVLPGDGYVFLDHRHAVENGMVAAREHPTGGPTRFGWNYVQFSDSDTSVGRPTPLLGEHNHEVLSEIGYDDSEIDQLGRNSVIKS